MNGLNFVTNDDTPHVGGNILEGDPATFRHLYGIT